MHHFSCHFTQQRCWIEHWNVMCNEVWLQWAIISLKLFSNRLNWIWKYTVNCTVTAICYHFVMLCKWINWTWNCAVHWTVTAISCPFTDFLRDWVEKNVLHIEQWLQSSFILLIFFKGIELNIEVCCALNCDCNDLSF